MRRLGKHTTYEFQTHVELDAPSVMCSGYYMYNYYNAGYGSTGQLVVSSIKSTYEKKLLIASHQTLCTK